MIITVYQLTHISSHLRRILFVLQPFQPIVWLVRWLLGRLAWLAIETNIYHVLFPEWIQAQNEGIYFIILFII